MRKRNKDTANPRSQASANSADELVAMGCDRAELVKSLQAIATASSKFSPSLPTLRGGTARERRRKLKRILDVAKDIEALLETSAGNMTTILGEFDENGPNEAEYRRLPKVLKAFADWFDSVSAETRHPTVAVTDYCIGLLLKYVESATRDHQPHDREVAKLISALPGFGGYTHIAQKRWRESKYKSLVKFLS